MRTISGARLNTLQQVLVATEATKSIEKVVLHVGTNNIAGRHSDTVQQCMKEYSVLLDTVKEKMPDAKIAVSALPPLKPWGKSRPMHLTWKSWNCVAMPHNELWEVDDDGMLDPRILRDKVHLSMAGLGLFLRDTKAFLTGSRARHNSHSHTSTSGDGNCSASYASMVAGQHSSSKKD